MDFKKLEYKALIQNSDGPSDSSHTLYLYNEQEQIIVPISLNTASAQDVFEITNNPEAPRPKIHFVVRSMLQCLKASIEDIIIYKYLDGVYYSHIRVVMNKDVFDIDSRISDSICLAFALKIKVSILDEVLEEVGIKVSKELLNDN